jgi:16S rRNA (uracil1498-N3)-methyltransferase
MHRVHAPGAEPPAIVVRGPEAHHLARVLRLRPGDDVVVFDGRGREWSGRLSAVTPSTATIDGLEPRTPVPEPSVFVTLAIAVLKGDQMDAVVRDATMMGASVVAPFVSAHVVVPERAWRSRSVDRWTRVAVASARQCRRAVVPEIRPVTTLDELLADRKSGPGVLCAEPAVAVGQSDDRLPRHDRALVLIGPEGGWSLEELERARGAGVFFLGLGPRTLRAESAPIVALTALWTMWGWR